MPPKPSRNTKRAWTEALEITITSPDRPEGEGWMSTSEIVADKELNPCGLTRQTMQENLRRKVDCGKLESAFGLSENRKRTRFYRPRKK
jgi:hypothetical protein